jgi:hypothetical protein
MKIIDLITKQKRLREQLVFFSQMVNTDIQWLSPAYPNLVSICKQLLLVYKVCESVKCSKSKMRKQLDSFLINYSDDNELNTHESMLINRYTYILKRNWMTFYQEDIASFRNRLNEIK